MEKFVLISDSYAIENQKDIFSRYAECYDNIVAQTSFYRKLISNAARSLGECKSVVDFGCATGNLAIELAKRGIKVLGIDNNAAMIEIARKKIENEGLAEYIEIVNSDITKITLEEGAYDGAAMLNVMYLLDNPYEVIDKIYATLKNGGVLVVSGPKPNQNLNLLQKTIYQEFKRAGILEKYSKDIEVVMEVNKILEKSIKHFFTTERLKEILIDFAGFSDVVANDSMPGYRTYLGQGHFLAVRKGIDYANLSPEEIKIRFAKEDEIKRLYRIRYHFTKERFGVLESTPEQDASFMEIDEYDKHSLHFVAEHNNKVLSIMRLVKDSNKLKLPIDLEHEIDYLRENGAIVGEPGRWISLPFAPNGTGRRVFRALYEYAKMNGVTHFAELHGTDYLNLYKKMGFQMNKQTPKNVLRYKEKAYIEIFQLENPPAFFKENLIDTAIINFLESLETQMIA